MLEFDAGRKTGLIRLFSAGVAELADAQDLGSCTERCRGSTPLSCIGRMLAAALLAAAWSAAGPASARADSLTIHGADGSGFTLDSVRIDRIDGGAVYYQLNGDLKSRPATEVATMQLDDEPDFDSGEAAYQIKHWEDAVTGFSTAMTSSSRDWLKDWIAPRLLESAEHTAHFDAAVTAWTRLAGIDATTAAIERPPLPVEPGALDAAAKQLDAAAQLEKGPSRRLILSMLLDVQNARHDAAAADTVTKELQQTEPAQTAPDAAALQSVEQQTRVTMAQTALNSGQYDQAISVIDSAAAIIVDPALQADALFLRAQALEAKAAGASQPGPWQDAALAYMRVYVHFRDGQASGHSAASLIKTAQIEELRLHDPKAALALYRKVVSEYNGTPEAHQADFEITRLAANGR
jgi:hypothetical protein